MNYYMKLSEANSIEYYIFHIVSLVLFYFSLLILTYILKNKKDVFTEINDKKENNKLSLADNFTPQQIKLMWKFLLVSTFIKAATWIKAPYLFALYNRVHEFSRNDIGVLYALDNMSSLISGPLFGSLCDMYGRKKFCLLFCVFVVAHIALRLTGIHNLAYLAQILSGFSGCLMETAFESWINFEANLEFEVNTNEGVRKKNCFLREIFTKQTNLDCLCSIFLTGIATILYMNFGIFYPFYACIVLTIFAFFLILFFWNENQCEKSQKIEKKESKLYFLENLRISYNILREDEALASIGLIEALFKVSLNLFLFIWTPLLEETAGGHIHPGAIFVCFMLARLIGSELFESIKLLFKTNTYFILIIVTITGCFSFFIDFYVFSFNVRFFMFIYFDGVSGILSPLMSSLKSQMIPEKYRTTIMNFFRMPVNIFSIITLLLTHLVTTHQICLIACSFMLTASMVNSYLIIYHSPPDKEIERNNSSESINKLNRNQSIINK